jgi:hypothetical protein
MTAAAARSLYAALSDEALEREAHVLKRKVSSVRHATSAIGLSLYREFSKRLDQVLAELDYRRQV